MDLFDTRPVLDIGGYDLAVAMGDIRRRNNITENQANVRYTLKTGDSLQRSQLRQAGHTGLDFIGSAPLSPSTQQEDLLPPTTLNGEFPDQDAADLAVYGMAAQQSLEAISATCELDWNPYLQNGRFVERGGDLYRIIELAHNLDQASTTLTVVPVVASGGPF